jgi:hypothetical protein
VFTGAPDVPRDVTTVAPCVPVTSPTRDPVKDPDDPVTLPDIGEEKVFVPFIV